MLAVGEQFSDAIQSGKNDHPFSTTLGTVIDMADADI